MQRRQSVVGGERERLVTSFRRDTQEIKLCHVFENHSVTKAEKSYNYLPWSKSTCPVLNIEFRMKKRLLSGFRKLVSGPDIFVVTSTRLPPILILGLKQFCFPRLGSRASVMGP